MNAELIFKESIRYDRGGKPLEVVIPYEKFIHFIESNGLDLTDAEKVCLREAHAEFKAGDVDAFISSEEAKRQLGV